METTALQEVWLVRHGQTAWTVTGQHTGRSDIPLTARGEEEARRLTALLQHTRFVNVFTSPLQRARWTCELAGFASAAQVDADLIEWDYGAYEGRRTSDIRAEHPRWRLFEDGCPGGETAEAVGVRADRVIARVRSCAGNVILFGHRDMLRVLAARWLGLTARDGALFFLDTASVSILGYDHDVSEPVIRLLNEVPR
jgi:broad specificity phosphatase PhoE